MAAVAPPADQAADLLKKLSLDSQTKNLEMPDATKKPSTDSNNRANGFRVERSLTPLIPDFVDPTMCYMPNGYPSPAYYYGGYDGSTNEWEDYTRFVNTEGVEMTPGVYGDSGSLLYHHGFGYAPYAPYAPAASPVPTVGHDGQLYGSQQYQYPPPYFQSPTPTSGPYPTPAAPLKGELVTSAAADQTSLSVDSTNSKSNGIANSMHTKGNNGTVPVRSTQQNSSMKVNGSYGKGGFPGGIPASGYHDARVGFDGLQSVMPWYESPYFSDGQPRPLTNSSLTSTVPNGTGVGSRNNNFRPQLMGLHHPSQISGMSTANGYMSRMYPNKIYGQYGNAYRSGMGYGSYGYDSRANGRGWMAVDSKYKPKGRGNGSYNYNIEGIDGLNELNRGPRAKISKNQKGFTPVALSVKGQTIPITVTTGGHEEKKSTAIPDREQYNRPDFPETYADAKFFIIKSYSEDDVHKSIKYNVWASTPNGNKKLDLAYLDAQKRPGSCPVFLLFSVNTSGQFVGVAEMMGQVDFEKNVGYWQQDKWVGCFPVKWHIVKDVPNSLLKHITLENNENKPVTNSRDTQEVKLEHGLQLIKIFKDHASRLCILDDFDFYEDREKKMLEKKAKQQQFQKHVRVSDCKNVQDRIKEGTNGDLEPKEVTNVIPLPNKQATPLVHANGDNQTTESVSLTKTGADILKNVTSAVVPEKNLVGNGIANCC
ncbi:YTH domain-containing protein ECT4-like [Andrographis paniculata]|uniref:YTH domain-containing protein ECT4-like n=1 Tax=Andrographis paniculata TaxID=175694 RepID=UPI0021E7834D|nr:YTH domain-containing protein ECT4-like [Andrographis paniculata]